MRTKILLMAAVVAIVGICFGADVYAQPVKALVINAAIDDISSRLRIQENQIKPVSIRSDLANPNLFTVVLQGPNPLTSRASDTFTYTIKVNKHPNSVTPKVQIIGVNYSDGSYDRYFYSGTLVSRIEQFDALGNSKATILYYGKGNRSLAGRINMITHWKTENNVKTAKYTDVYKYVNNYNLRSFEVFRYKGDVWAPEAKPLCVFLYAGRAGLEKLAKCTFADGSYITYANELAQAVFAAGSSTPGITFRYLDANGQPTTKNIATTVVSYFGGKFKIAHEGIIDPVDVVVEYKSRELIGHKIIVDGYGTGEFVWAKEIWTFLTPDTPYVEEQWILTYSDEARTNVIDAQIVRTFDTGDEYTDHQQILTYMPDGAFAQAQDITNYYMDSPSGRFLYCSIIDTYMDENMTPQSQTMRQVITWIGDLLDIQEMRSYDENGVFMEAQKILTFDTSWQPYHTEQWIFRYSDEAMTKANMLDATIVRTFDTGDEYTNHQQVLTYTPTGIFVDAKDITNYYINTPSGRFMEHSIIWTYADEAMTELIERKDIWNDYDYINSIGYVVYNYSETGELMYIEKHGDIVRDSNGLIVSEKVIVLGADGQSIIEMKLIENLVINGSGRVLETMITRYALNGDVVEKRLIENLNFDVAGRVTLQAVTIFDDNGAFLYKQFIENLVFDAAARITQLRVTTYNEAGQIVCWDDTWITAFDSQGRVLEMTTINYAGDGTLESRKTIVNMYNGRYDWYDWCDPSINPPAKQVVKNYDNLGNVTMTTQTEILARDQEGRITDTKVTRWGGNGNFIEMQMITNVSFDEYAKVIEQIVDTYDEAGNLVSHKVITNDYSVDPYRPQSMPVAEPLSQPASDITNDVIGEILSKQDAIQASRSQLSGGKFQRKSMFEDESPLQLRWNRK